jgi:hypothetical protein
MPVSPDALLGPRLKVERAYRHINELISATEPLSRDLYTIRVETNVELVGDRIPYALMYRPTKPVPETLALIIGDAVHNLRAALDHLVSGIVATGVRERFPVHPLRKNLEAAPVLNAIEQALPGAKRLILEEIRPEDGPNETLWAFNGLDNDDKHNLILPTVTVATVRNINARVGNNSYVDCSVGGDGSKPIAIFGTAMPMAAQGDFQTSVEVSFRNGIFAGEPVVPTLTKIVEVVSKTIDSFERLIRAE